MAIHADELTPTELAIQMSAATVSTADIFSPRRRDQLNLFRSYLPRLGMSAGVSRLWFDRNHFHFIAVTCSRQADFGRFRNRVAPALDRVFPLLAVAERLVRAPSTASDAAGSVSPELAREFKLTPAEGDTLALVLRGLTNREIAHVHGLSVNTVRNRLSVCFQKLGATRRTEALFILGEARRKQAVSSEPPLAQLQRWLASARSARKA
jgi:DNA-binding CsgD family transcriptional regulator